MVLSEPVLSFGMLSVLILLSLTAALVAAPEYPANWRKPIIGLLAAVMLAVAVSAFGAQVGTDVALPDSCRTCEGWYCIFFFCW